MCGVRMAQQPASVIFRSTSDFTPVLQRPVAAPTSPCRAGDIGQDFLFVGSERAAHAAAIYYSLVESCKANKVNPLTYLTYIVANARNRAVVLPTPDEFADPSATPACGCAL